jgi:hypothetical protein
VMLMRRDMMFGWMQLATDVQQSMKSMGQLATHTTQNSQLEAAQEVVMNPCHLMNFVLDVKLQGF